MSITSNFVTAFKPSNQEHVKWLSNMIDYAEMLGDPQKHVDLVKEINKNPLKIKLETKDALDWPHIHFCLCAVYAKAVLRGQAWIPTVSATPAGSGSLSFS